MGLFERYLTIWVGLGIAAGVGLGLWAPGLFQAVAALEYAHVNLVVAVFIWGTKIATTGSATADGRLRC